MPPSLGLCASKTALSINARVPAKPVTYCRRVRHALPADILDVLYEYISGAKLVDYVYEKGKAVSMELVSANGTITLPHDEIAGSSFCDYFRALQTNCPDNFCTILDGERELFFVPMPTKEQDARRVKQYCVNNYTEDRHRVLTSQNTIGATSLGKQLTRWNWTKTFENMFCCWGIAIVRD